MKDMNQSRRDFLRMAGKAALGAAAVSMVPLAVKADGTPDVPEWPWTWHPIDKQKALELLVKYLGLFEDADAEDKSLRVVFDCPEEWTE